jgi:hypothetical protein
VANRYGAGDEIMSTYDTTIGSRHFTLHPRAHRKNGSTKPSTEYQAGFEAGFIVGREAGLKEAEGRKAPLAQLTAAKNNVTVLLRPSVASDRILLGLRAVVAARTTAATRSAAPCANRQKTVQPFD